MRTIQMTIDESLLNAVDAATHELGTTRSEFIRRALQLALRQMRIDEMERQHREGYARQPVEEGEFDVWQSEQAWGNE